MPSDSGVSRTFFCYLPPLVAGSTATLSLDITAPLSYQARERWPDVRAEAQTPGTGQAMPDLNPTDNQARLIISVT
jgi:hypothetical protein